MLAVTNSDEINIGIHKMIHDVLKNNKYASDCALISNQMKHQAKEIPPVPSSCNAAPKPYNKVLDIPLKVIVPLMVHEATQTEGIVSLAINYFGSIQNMLLNIENERATSFRSNLAKNHGVKVAYTFFDCVKIIQCISTSAILSC